MTLFEPIDKNVILVPLTSDTKLQHEYFLKSALVDVVIEGCSVRRIEHDRKHDLIEKLRLKAHAELVLFSTGTTGRPKAILHDLTLFMRRFETRRPTLKTISFLLFDYIGGLNTLLHTLFNKGTVIALKSRSVGNILATCADHKVEVLPTTPTFLRMILMSGLIPDVDFRQTFGMSELGIVRVKSKARNSLFMKVGGEGVETRVVDSVLEIRSQTRMLGYLNADSPFDKGGWYNTKDIVKERDGYY